MQLDAGKKKISFFFVFNYVALDVLAGCGFGFAYSGTLIGIFDGLIKHCGVVR